MCVALLQEITVAEIPKTLRIRFRQHGPTALREDIQLHGEVLQLRVG
jgi:hypothetical protein